MPRNPAEKTIACHNCKTVNPANYTFCFRCRVTPKAPAKAKAAKAAKPKAKPAKATTRKK